MAKNDSMLVSIDRLTVSTTRRFRVQYYGYVLAVVADNLGKVMITEPMAPSRITLRPGRGQTEFEWPILGDGLSIYHRTGGLPSIIKGEILIYESRQRLRDAGEIVTAITDDKAVVAAVAAFSPQSLVLGPVVNAIGNYLSARKDRLLQRIPGSFYLDAARKDEVELNHRAHWGDFDISITADLFDGEDEEDSTASFAEIELEQLNKKGRLLVNQPQEEVPVVPVVDDTPPS